MGKKILDSKILYVVLSVILTVGIWCYVTAADGTPQSRTYANVPVIFEGRDILEDRGLMIINDDVTATVTVQATPAVHARLSAGWSDGDMSVTVKVSGVSEEGSQSLAYVVNLPSTVSSSEVNFTTGTRGSVVTVEVARFLRREIPIEGSFQGNAAEGYLAGNEEDFQFSPGTIWINGQEEEVKKVHHALVVVTGENLTENVSNEYPFKLIGASNDELTDLDVTCDVDMVYTIFPIRATAEIPLKIALTPGGGLGEDDVVVTLNPTDTIMVAGGKDAVAALANEGAITLGRVDLASIQNGDEKTFSVPLEDGLENLSGVTEVTAVFTVVKRVVSQSFTATQIQIINRPEGWDVDVVTQVLPVEIRGTQELISELIEENIRVVADLQNITPAPGSFTVPVSISLDSVGTKSEIGEMVLPGSNYTVVVTFTPAEAD